MDAIQRIDDTFRAAAIGQADWTEAIALLGHATGATIGQVVALDAFGHVLVNHCYNLTDDLKQEWVTEGGADPLVNPRTRAVLGAPLLTTLIEEDFISAAEVRRTAIYDGLFRRAGAQHACLVRLAPTAGLAMMRDAKRGAADREERAVTQHVAIGIATALATALRIGTAIGATALSTAEHLAVPALILSAGGSVVSLSPRAEALLRAGTHVTLRRGRLHAVTAAGSIALDRVLAAAAERPAGVVSVAIPGIDGAVTLAGELMPLAGHGNGCIAVGQYLLTLTHVRRSRDAAAAWIAADTGVTAAERQVLELLVRGQDTQQIATARGTSLATTRNQIKSLLAKTGCKRQAELMLKLAEF